MEDLELLVILIIVAIAILACFKLCRHNEDSQRRHHYEHGSGVSGGYFTVAQKAHNRERHINREGSYYQPYQGREARRRFSFEAHSVRPQALGRRVRVEVYRHLRNEFHLFIQYIVYLFHQQRNPDSGEYQFAVLFLSSNTNLTTSNMTFQSRNCVVSTPATATDNATPTYPPSKELCNYITARPEGPNHAEKLLMDRFSTLLRSYTHLQMPRCRSIVLYTWLLPCPYCKREIIKVLQPYCKREIIKGLQPYVEQCQVILVYTTKMRDVDEEQAAGIIRDLEDNGLIVKQETYDQYLPPASNIW